MMNSGKLFFKVLVLLLAFVTVFALVSCSGTVDKDGGDEGAPPYNNGNEDGSDVNDMIGESESGDGSSSTDRKIIKTVYTEIETENYATFVKSLKQSVTDNGGYISSSKFSGGNDGELRYATLVIRIPAENLDTFTGTVGDIGTVSSYEESERDVTLKYVDIVSRIEVLEAEKAALTSLLENASSTADILAIRSQLEKVLEELASLKSQKNVYDNQIAYSTVNMEIYEVEKETSDESSSFFTRVGNLFMSTLGAIGTFFSTLGVIILGGSPVLILLAVIGIGIYFLVKFIIKRVNKASAPQQYQQYPSNMQQNNQQNTSKQ